MLKIDQFCTAYEERLIATYAWAEQTHKRARYMENVRNTLTGKQATWIHEGPLVMQTLNELGWRRPKSLADFRELIKEGTKP